MTKDNVSGNCSREESLSNSFGPPHFTTTNNGLSLKSQRSESFGPPHFTTTNNGLSLKSQRSKFPDYRLCTMYHGRARFT